MIPTGLEPALSRLKSGTSKPLDDGTFVLSHEYRKQVLMSINIWLLPFSKPEKKIRNKSYKGN